jgi:ABC-2 type transport system ATP-binding protein
MIKIEIQNLTKIFGKLKAVDNISLSVNKGEIFGYLGPNGAGKSTTIACMMDFIKADSGNVYINGLDASVNSSALKMQIGYLSPDVHLYSNMTGREHIDMYKRVLGNTPLLDRLMKDFAFDLTKKTAHLSTGTKQKLAIILTLMSQPEILILDEPTRGLDPILQNMFYEYLIEFKNNGSTIFMSSHIITEIEKLCDHVGIIRNGKLMSIETVSTLKSKNIQKVNVLFENELDEKILSKLSLVSYKRKLGNEYEFSYSGDINILLQFLSKYRIKNLEIQHAPLEEIFLEYYK